ncbi:hypothetical protein A1S_2401 [Acinetobacter baumannii ATCC 17978]|nr:hypothetical protein A1S_2401 [Acinetobacter baumannii ATCC 17978]
MQDDKTSAQQQVKERACCSAHVSLTHHLEPNAEVFEKNQTVLSVQQYDDQ